MTRGPSQPPVPLAAPASAPTSAWVRHDPCATITTWAHRDGQPLALRFERSEEPGRAVDEAAVAQAWADRLARNDRLFNGPIAAVARFDPQTGTIRWRRDEYRRLAVARVVETGTVQLSVMALLFAPDEHAQRCVMLARRSSAVAVYPGLWEFGPSGGIDPPESGPLDPAAIAHQLAREIREEIAAAVDPHRITPTMIVRDAAAASLDIACRVEMDRASTPGGDSASWEYDAIAWVPIARLGAWIEQHRGAVSAPTIGVSRVLAAKPNLTS